MTSPAILVPLDGSKGALAALPVAKVLSKIHQSSLCLAHVADKEPADPELVSRLNRWARELDSARIEVRAGEPAAHILRLAEEIGSRMIVLCKLTAAMQPTGLGSTAAAVLCRASCPLVVVPPERGSVPWHLQHILVPHDGTPSTSVGLKPAAELAELAGAELLVAHVTGLGPAPASPVRSPRRLTWISRSTNGPHGPASSSGVLPACARWAICMFGYSSPTAIPHRSFCALPKSNRRIC